MTGNQRKLFEGQALLEVLIASGIFLMVSTSITGIIFSSRSLVTDAQQSSQATALAKEGLEASRLLRDQSWSNLQDGSHGLIKSGNDWLFSGISDQQNGYTRTVTISPRSANSKLVTSRVNWTVPPSRTPYIVVSTVLTNWQQAQQENNISGDWTNPVTAGIADVDTGAQGTDVIVENNMVYLSSSSSQIDKPDLTIFNVSDPNNPVRISSFDAGVSNISAITKQGNYIYASITGSVDEFMVINVSNPASPSVVRSMSFSNGRSQTLAASGNILYVGLEQISGEEEFFSVDITDPANPVVLDSLELNATVHSIAVFNNRAYIATSGDISELVVVDVSSPQAMTVAGTFDATSTADGYSVSVKDEFNVYLGRDQSGTGEEFYILDASDPASIVVKGKTELTARVNDMVAVNHLVFTVTEQPNAEFRILDITNPLSIYSYSYLNFPQNALGIDFANNTVYTAVRSNSALRIIVSG